MWSVQGVAEGALRADPRRCFGAGVAGRAQLGRVGAVEALSRVLGPPPPVRPDMPTADGEAAGGEGEAADKGADPQLVTSPTDRHCLPPQMHAASAPIVRQSQGSPSVAAGVAGRALRCHSGPACA